MIETINKNQFMDRFSQMGREKQFSYDGKTALFEYLEEQEESIGEPQELDIIALCCEYVEYENIKDFWKDYDKEDYSDMEAIRDHTEVIMVRDKGFIIQQF